MVRGVWTDAGNDPPYGKLPAHGITSCWFDPRDPRVTASYLDGVVAHGYSAGLYFAWDWHEELDGPHFAEWCDSELRRIGWRGNPPACLDLETHDLAGYVLPCLKRWRELRPTRATWWTFEGMQGGTFDTATVAALDALGIRFAPSMYAGNMVPLAHDVTIDLLMAGFAGEKLDGMYDAADLPYRWRGFAFTGGRLP